MMNDNIVKRRVEDPYIIIDELDEYPHTYDTILCDNFNSTWNFIIRRKLSALCKMNLLCKATIPGTRYGKVIFYKLDKKYKILIKNERIGISIFYFFKYEKINKLYIKLNRYFKLENNRWVEYNNEIIISAGDTLKII
jgi:hypothetical protein